jgi:HK97 gp10 family phage protein
VIDIKIEGFEDAIQALKDLAKDMRRRVVRGALRAAARPIVNQARVNAPFRNFLIRKRMSVMTSRVASRRGEVGVYIRPRATAIARRQKLKALDPYYYKFHEAGFYKVGAKMFMGRAFESRGSEALAIFKAQIRARIDAANRRK